MVLTRIKSSRIGFELRTFQGVNCDHVDKVVTETKSMKWISSGLRAPAVAARFVSPLASTAPKSADLKGTVNDLPRPAKAKKGARRNYEDTSEIS
jgi:hypothetical protein